MHRILPPAGDVQDEEIDLTPMLDVTFILLIFFIVTATFVREVGIHADLVDPRAASKAGDDPALLVRIAEDDRVSIREHRVELHAVRAHLERVHAQDPQLAIVIRPHPGSSTGALVHVMDAARQVDPGLQVALEGSP